MDVLIVGLGLIGGAYAKRLSARGYRVYGVDKNKDTLSYAYDNNYCYDTSTDETKFVGTADIIVICLYPKDILPFIERNKDSFRQNQVITDVCGIKESFLEEATKNSYPADYLSHHPMAGKEKVGIKYSGLVKFTDASFLITPSRDTNPRSIHILQKMSKDLEFMHTYIITPEEHDKMIAYTSQLTHAIAVSLVNSDPSTTTKRFIGDSYRDLTRIAKINVPLWTELFLENKKNLINEIDGFTKSITLLRNAILNEDEEGIKEIFNKSRLIRSEMEK